VDEVVVLEGGRTTNGLRHPGADGDSVLSEALVGFHVGTLRSTFHLTYSRLLSGEEGRNSDSAWLNFSFERRF
jgi:hypothetical protein